MSDFGNFLYGLRKEKNMTQADLADLLGVTNKAVSKWEMGAAFPETSQLVPIADIFGVTVDELLKGRRDGGYSDESRANAGGQAPQNVVFDREEDDDETDFSPERVKMSQTEITMTVLGVALILIGVFALVVMAHFDVAYPIYLTSLFVCVAGGVSIFIITDGVKNAARFEVSDEQKSQYKRNNRLLALGVALLIMSPVNWFYDDYAETQYLMIGFFAVLFAGVLITVLSGLKMENTEKISRANKVMKNVENGRGQIYAAKQKNRAAGIAGAIAMPLAVIIYMIMGFVFNNWHPSWIVFPIAALTVGIISGVAQQK